MKIRYMKDKVKRHLHLNKKKFQFIFYVYLAFMQNFKIYFWHKYKTTNKN